MSIHRSYQGVSGRVNELNNSGKMQIEYKMHLEKNVLKDSTSANKPAEQMRELEEAED